MWRVERFKSERMSKERKVRLKSRHCDGLESVTRAEETTFFCQNIAIINGCRLLEANGSCRVSLIQHRNRPKVLGHIRSREASGGL